MNEMVALMNTPELPRNTVICGDCLDVLREMADCSVDAIVTDPPAGINFMNMQFDSDKGGRDNWIAWLTEVMKEALRVIRPGGHAFVWALPRTSHWTATALEDAGWEIREVVVHLFGSGFPKSHDISKAIDKMQGAEREIEGYYNPASLYDGCNRVEGIKYTGNVLNGGKRGGTTRTPITSPATDLAKKHAGTGTALKPSNEHWILCRKPLSEPTIAQNVLKWNGCGGLNIDKCRVGTAEDMNPNDFDDSKRTAPKFSGILNGGKEGQYCARTGTVPNGRWPSNTLFSHTIFCRQTGVKRVRGTAPHGKPTLHEERKPGTSWSMANTRSSVQHSDPDGMETIDAWECSESCPVRILGEQSGVRKSGGVTRNNSHKSGMFLRGYPDSFEGYSDEGTASRYFAQFSPSPDELEVPFLYASKASKRERDAGLEHLPAQQGFDKNTSKKIAHINHATGETTYSEYQPSARHNSHPTVKPLSLLKYLITLITPPGGIVLDCFAGSGSTGVAAIQTGHAFILVEQSSEYVEIARARIQHAMQEAGIVEVQGDGGEWICSDDCPVKILGEQSGIRKHGGPIKSNGVGMFHGTKTVATTDHYGDEGTAARYFAQFAPDSLWSLLEDEVPE